MDPARRHGWMDNGQAAFQHGVLPGPGREGRRCVRHLSCPVALGGARERLKKSILTSPPHVVSGIMAYGHSRNVTSFFVQTQGCREMTWLQGHSTNIYLFPWTLHLLPFCMRSLPKETPPRNIFLCCESSLCSQYFLFFEDRPSP